MAAVRTSLNARAGKGVTAKPAGPRRVTRRSPSRLQFRVGDPVVVPPHGVGRVQGVLVQKWDGKSHKFYRIAMPGPPPWEGTFRLDRLVINRVRQVMSRHRAREVMRILRTPPERYAADTWRQRKVEGKEALDRGDVIQTAKLVRDLRKRGPESGRAEAQDVELAKLSTTLLVQELAAAEETSVEEMQQRVERALTEIV